MKLRIFMTVLITGGVLIFSFAGHAEKPNLSKANRENVQEIGLKFASCSGIYAAVSEIHAATNSTVLAKSTEEVSNGAWLASAYLLFSTGVIPDWKKAMTYAENTASSTKLSYMASFEKPDANKAMTELTDAMKECNLLGKLQEELVQEARLKAYAQNPQ